MSTHNLPSRLWKKSAVTFQDRSGLQALVLAVRLIALIGAFATTLRKADAELLPNARTVTWSAGINVGVPGGIPTNRTNIIDVTRPPYSADNTGVNDASPAIQSAINAAQAGDVVHVPSGIYRLNSTLRLDHNRSGITLRGAGPSTVMKLSAGSGFVYMGSPPNWTWPTTLTRVAGGLHKGSTELTMADTAEFKAGNNVLLGMANDPSLPVVSVSGFDLDPHFQPMRRQLTRVVSKTKTTLTIFPPLYTDYSKTSVVARVCQLQGNSIGVENFRVEAENSSDPMPVRMESCYASWIKGVHVRRAKNYAIYVSNSLQCEIRECNMEELQGSGTNGAGLLVETTAGCLYEDNIISKAFPLIEVNHGAAGNVFAYNFLNDSKIGIDTNHAPHNSFNLYEGNVSPNLLADGYFGSVSDDTVFRNWITGMNPSGPTYVLVLKRFTRNYSIVANVLGTSGLNDGMYEFGTPNMGNGFWSGTAQLSVGSAWADYRRVGTITERSSDNAAKVHIPFGTQGLATSQWPISARWNSNAREWLEVKSVSEGSVTLGDGRNPSYGSPLPPVGATIQLWPGPSGFQERDLDVEATTLKKGNYLAKRDGGGAVPANESLDGEGLPLSLFRSAKPKWFGDLPWPAFGPDAPNQKYDAIPAGYRFMHGRPPPGVANETSAQAPNNVRIRVE